MAFAAAGKIYLLLTKPTAGSLERPYMPWTRAGGLAEGQRWTFMRGVGDVVLEQ
jgi:hypothetical protein